MIVRLWKGRASADAAAAYRTHVTTRVFDELRRMKGFLRGRVFQRQRDGHVEFLVTTEWASWDAIRAFAGDDVDRAVVEPAAQACLTEFDARVDHFELLDEVTAAAT